MNQIILTFNEEALEIHSLTMNHVVTGGNATALFENFQHTPRIANFQIYVWDPDGGFQPVGGETLYTNIVGEYTAQRYAEFFELDYGLNGIIEVEQNGNQVTLTAQPNHEFQAPTIGGGLDVTWQLNSVNQNPFEIAQVIFGDRAGEECSKFELLIQTSELINQVSINSVPTYSDWNSTIFSDIFVRGVQYTIAFRDYNNQSESLGPIGVPILDPTAMGVSVTNGATGATVVLLYNPVLNPVFEQLDLEYSLDGVNYVSTNVFTGQPDGDYTYYLRDNYGCVRTYNFTVAAGIQRTPNHFISKANSINYVLEELTDNCETFDNIENSFTLDDLNRKKYCTEILFNLCDKIKTQLKTNYENISVTLRKENSADVLINTITQSTNLNRYLSLDAIVYSYQEDLTGVYFEAGDTYNELGVVNGQFSLNGNLPDFAKVGNTITIGDLGEFEIQQILYDENIQKNVIIVQNNFVSLPTQYIVSSVFDLLNFEIVEFEIDWSLYGEGLYDVVIELTDDSFPTVRYVSENIWIQNEHENTVCIIYYNDNNRDIFYKYGIKHKIRVEIEEINYDVTDDQETNIGDFSSELISSSIALKDTYHFSELPANRRNTLIIALGCEFLFINGLGYAKETNVNLEHISRTNLAEVKQDLIRTNVNYTIDNQNDVPLDDATLFDVPQLLNSDNINLLKRK